MFSVSLDIIAVAPGRLVPVSYVKVVQPVDAGIIKEILVREGDAVKAGLQRVSADASEQPEREVRDAAAAGYRFRSIVELKSQVLESDGVRHPLTPGMQVDAEIALGERSVLEYILSPVRKAFHEAARER